MNALTAAQGELECAYDSIMDITNDAHVQLNHVVESGQDVTALEQEVTKYGCKQGGHSPLHDDASVSGDSHAVASRRRAQTAREQAELAERHRPFLVERQELARQREEFQRQKLELERDVELFRAEQAAAKAEHESAWRSLRRHQSGRLVANTPSTMRRCPDNVYEPFSLPLVLQELRTRTTTVRTVKVVLRATSH